MTDKPEPPDPWSGPVLGGGGGFAPELDVRLSGPDGYGNRRQIIVRPEPKRCR